MSAVTTVIGNTTSDFELRFTQGGKAVANVTVAVSERKFDKTKNEYVDGETWFARCTVWGELAENVAASILKGTRVIGQGRIGQRDWEDKDGGKRTSVEVTLDSIGPDLRYSTASVTRASSGNRGGTEATTGEPWANTPAANPAASQGESNGFAFEGDSPF